jgi:hypothetical protein
MNQTLVRLFLVLAIAQSAVPAIAQEPGPEKELRKRIEVLEKRLSELEARSVGPPMRPGSSPEKPQEPIKAPLEFADFTWLNGNSRVTNPLVDNKYFTGQFMLDANYVYSFNKPKDHTLVGGCETGRSNEFQVQQLGLGGDLHVGMSAGG